MKVRRVDFSPDEWLSGTLGMTSEEIGVYITICSLIYSRGGAIPDDENWLTKVCGCKHWRTFRAIRCNLIERGKIEIESNKIVVRRCILELEKATKRSSEASQNAKTRWAKNSQDEFRMSSETVQDDFMNGSGSIHDDFTPSVNGHDNNHLTDADAVQTRNANHQPSTINYHLPPISPVGGLDYGKSKRSPKRDTDPWKLSGIHPDELGRRFNDKSRPRDERLAIRKILFPNAYPPEPGTFN